MSSDARLPEIEAWLLDNMDTAPATLLGQGYQATVTRYESPFGAIVVKSPHRSALLGYFGKLTIRRELRIYRQLKDISGIPALYGLIAGRHLVLEAIDGPPLRDAEDALMARDAFFAQLLNTVEAMHAAGIAHGDLKRKANILIGPDQRPYLIDFGIACRSGPRGLRRWRFEWTRQLDYNAWIKLKYGRAAVELSDEDAGRYRTLWIERLARWIRVPWQVLTLRRPRQRFWRWWRS
jgi:predicted Ser/Thr protein kinase